MSHNLIHSCCADEISKAVLTATKKAQTSVALLEAELSAIKRNNMTQYCQSQSHLRLTSKNVFNSVHIYFELQKTN